MTVAEIPPVTMKILDRILVGDGCWEWTGHKDAKGYGRIGIGSRSSGKVYFVHRLMYASFVGPIPDGLVADHLCRNRSCVKPSHLEMVTRKENNLRGNCPSALAARKTHCKHGHEFAGDNLRLRETAKGTERICRQCARDRVQRKRVTQ